jgi:ribosomal protein S18 acetylase RimI-like enzyme
MVSVHVALYYQNSSRDYNYDDMNLRRAEAIDAEKCARVHVAAWQAAYRGLVPEEFLAGFTLEKRSAAFRTALENHTEETYLLEQGDEPVAILTIGPNRDEDLDPVVDGELWGIYISPGWWRRRIGWQLVDEAEHILGMRGYGRVILWVFEKNHDARRFYEAMGYRPDGAEKRLDLVAPIKTLRYTKTLHLIDSEPE